MDCYLRARGDGDLLVGGFFSRALHQSRDDAWCCKSRTRPTNTEANQATASSPMCANCENCWGISVKSGRTAQAVVQVPRSELGAQRWMKPAPFFSFPREHAQVQTMHHIPMKLMLPTHIPHPPPFGPHPTVIGRCFKLVLNTFLLLQFFCKKFFFSFWGFLCLVKKLGQIYFFCMLRNFVCHLCHLTK